MRKVGNVASNKIYNPQNKKPPVPIDADEADSAMERFIRQKYMSSSINGTKRHNTGSTESDEGTPPPLPPKTGKFGFRSASSIFPLSSKAKREAALRTASAASRDSFRSPSPSPVSNKPSRVFGASVDSDFGEDMDNKLARLRDMGFNDTQRNLTVLKGVNGNLEQAIEALVRLGEGDRRSPNPFVPSRGNSLRASRSLTPMRPNSGLQVQIENQQPPTPSTVSSNPFDMMPAQPQSSQSTGTLQNKNPYFGNNPYGTPQQQDLISQAFQSLSLAPSQPLFPHHTGGLPAPHANPHPIYQQPVTPPVPPSAMQNHAAMSFNNNNHLTYPQPLQPMPNYNPFFAGQTQQELPQQHLALNTTSLPTNFGNNPFTRSPTRIQSPPLGQIPEQSQQNYYGPPQQQLPAEQITNPFFSTQVGIPVQPQQVAYPAVQQPLYQPQRPDKASILALYNYPQLAPRPMMQQDPSQAAILDIQPPNASIQASSTRQYQQPRSDSMPFPGTRNPFLMNSGPSSPVSQVQPPIATIPETMAAGNGPRGHVSRESVALGMDMAWTTNGRHSPDAFASLSAKHMG
jgi:hypothetical protein